MSLRRRVEIQRNQQRNITFTPSIENVGRIEVEPAGADLPWEIFDPAGVSVATGQATNTTIVDPNGNYSWVTITFTLNAPQALAAGYRLQQTYRLLGAPAAEVRTHQIFFDLVVQEWQTEVTLDTLRGLMPTIGGRLTKHGAYLNPVHNADDMAATYISNAMDKFDNILRSIILETRIATRASLVPDTSIFDRVIAKLAIALIFRADDSIERYRDFVGDAMSDWDNMTLVGYDTDENFIADDEVKAPDRREIARSILGDF